MTSLKVKQELSQWYNTCCTHEKPYHLWCTGKTCWEGYSLSSRFTEMHMKGIKARGIYDIPIPNDCNDFIEYNNGIMKNHPEWKIRLNEMSIYGRKWQRFIKYYQECENLEKEGKYNTLEELIKCFNDTHCKLRYFTFPENTPNVEFKEYLIVGSLVPRKHCDEFDISNCCVVDKLPELDFCCNFYDEKGKKIGWNRCYLQHPHKISETVSDDILNNIRKFEINFVDSFNNSRKIYNDKMLELYKKIQKGETIIDNELPIYINCINENNTSDKYEKIQNILQKNIIKCKHLIEIHLDNIFENMYTLEEQLNNYEMLHSLIGYCNFFCYEFKSFQEYEEEIEKITNLKNNAEQLQKKFKELYMNNFTNEIKMHNEIEKWIESNPVTFKNITYHYCPHFILYDEKDNGYTEEFEMYSVEICNDNLGIISLCLISISKNHILHPFNKDKNGDLVDWMNISFLVSDQIKKCSYYEEGLMNPF